jgi:hypothetical protein
LWLSTRSAGRLGAWGGGIAMAVAARGGAPPPPPPPSPRLSGGPTAVGAPLRAPGTSGCGRVGAPDGALPWPRGPPALAERAGWACERPRPVLAPAAGPPRLGLRLLLRLLLLRRRLDTTPLTFCLFHVEPGRGRRDGTDRSQHRVPVDAGRHPDILQQRMRVNSIGGVSLPAEQRHSARSVVTSFSSSSVRNGSSAPLMH